MMDEEERKRKWNAYMREYYRLPYVAEKRRKLHESDEYKAKAEARAKYQHEYMKEYRQRPEVKAAKHEATEVYRKKYPEKYSAHQAVSRALKKGVLVRPDTCEHCGASGVPIEGSHTDYANQLDVEWLCRPCHRIKDSV